MEKARVYNGCGLWYGEVYADWLIGGKEWRDVTSGHLTKLGATVALKLWIRRNTAYEVEI